LIAHFTTRAGTSPWGITLAAAASFWDFVTVRETPMAVRIQKIIIRAIKNKLQAFDDFIPLGQPPTVCAPVKIVAPGQTFPSGSILVHFNRSAHGGWCSAEPVARLDSATG
jgi:hypothetical protein